MEYQSINVTPIASTCGAEVSGVDLNNPSNQQMSEVIDAWHKYSVLMFLDQDLPPEQHKTFAKHFGDVSVHPIVNGMEGHPEVIRIHKAAGDSATFGVGWHSDNSFTEKPCSATILAAEKIPPIGGDTMFAQQSAAYDALSDGMKKMLDGLIGIHSAKYAFTVPTALERYDSEDTTITYEMNDAVYEEIEHPVVRTHPETGKKCLYVNEMFTIRFKDMTEEESKGLLQFLFHHSTKPEFCCRIRWKDNAVAMWDNRSVQHYAMDDYQEYERILRRVTVEGERPA